MVGFEKHKAELDALDARIVAGSVDPEDKAREVAAELSYPVAYGMTRGDADALGSWWEDRRGIIQPSEFILGAGGKVLNSMYSAGPVGRLHAGEVVRFLQVLEKRKAQQT